MDEIASLSNSGVQFAPPSVAPDAARHASEIIGVRFARYAFDGEGAAPAEWSDLAPLHAFE